MPHSVDAVCRWVRHSEHLQPARQAVEREQRAGEEEQRKDYKADYHLEPFEAVHVAA